MKYLFLIAPLLFSIYSHAEEVKDVLFGTSTETVVVPFGEPTVLKFEKRVVGYPEASSYTIKPEDEEIPDYTTLVVIPKFTTGSEKVNFTLEDKKIARIRFKTEMNLSQTFKELTYELRSKSHLDPSKAPAIGEVDLLKAMVKDNNVSGFKRKKVNKVISSLNKGVTTRLIRRYEGRNMTGYVFKLTNQLYRNKVNIDVRKFHIGSPNLAILSQSDHAVIYPKKKGNHETFVRIVAKPSSRYAKMKLPMTTEKIKKGAQK